MRRTTLQLVTILAMLVVVGTPVRAQLQFVRESFEAPAGWNWGLPTEIVESGGLPDAYLQSVGILDAALPKLRTGQGVSSPFVGDFRSAEVVGVRVSLQIGDVATPFGRDLSVELTDDAGTPGDVNDDCTVYLVGNDNIPLPGTGWQTYTFLVPSDSTQLPPGWELLSVAGNSCPGLTDDEAWNLVVTDVDELKFSYGDPSLFYIFQQWEGLGLENPTLATSR